MDQKFSKEWIESKVENFILCIFIVDVFIGPLTEAYRLYIHDIIKIILKFLSNKVFMNNLNL